MDLGWTIFRLKGIPVRVHFSLLVLSAFAALSLSTSSFSDNLSRPVHLAMGVAASLGYLGSVLLHEMGHAFQALREKLEVKQITLWMLGGFAVIDSSSMTPGKDLRVSAAGPLVTAGLAGLFAGLSSVARQAGWPEASHGVIRYLAVINLLLLAFNLIPAYPLDGGRILRAVLWHRRQNLTSSNQTVSVMGQAFGGLMMMGAVLSLVLPLPVNGIWLGVIGFFIFQGARSTSQQVMVHREPQGMVVGRFMRRDFGVVTPETTVSEFLGALDRLAVRPVFVVLKDGSPLGIISMSQADRVPAPERDRLTVGEVMSPRAELRSLKPSDPLSAAQEALSGGPDAAVVLEGDLLVGIVTLTELARAMVIGA